MFLEGKDSGISAVAAAAEKPPSVPEDLWASVPEEMRAEFVIEAALGLRRGIHPADTFERLIMEKGIAKVPPKVLPRSNKAARGPKLRTVSPPALRGAVPPPVGRKPSPEQVPCPSQQEIPEKVDLEEVLTKSGHPDVGKATRSIRKRIEADPVLSYWAPETCLSGFPDRMRHSLVPAVAEEALKKIEEMRSRMAIDGSDAPNFVDPDGWTFGLADTATTTGA